MISSVLVIVPFLAGINALNDWSVPCTSGECSYDLPTANSSASGSVKIWGSNNAITDITKAADWQILGCDPNALSQDIRLVCMNDPDDPNSKCGHLYQEIGAVNKIVRLPEDCGGSAFARIAKSWVPDDQSIPTSVRRSLVRRGGKAPVVKALALDTNFDSVDYSKTGPVNIAIQGANVPGAPNDIQAPSSRRARSTHRRFSIKDALGSVKDGIDNAASSVGDAAKGAIDGVKDAADAVGDKAKDAASKVESVAKSAATKVESKAKDAATKVESVAKGAATKAAKAAKTAAKDAAAAAKAVADNNVNVNKTFALKPLNFDKSVNLIDSSINCGKVSASLQVDMDANANAQATISVAATGTLAPPKLTSFGAVAGMTANVAGTMTMTADITGHVDSGKIQLVNLGIPGLDFPGILTVGPSFTVSAQVVGDVDVVMDMTVGINFDVNNAQLAFPPDDSNKPASSAFSIGDTPLTLNAAPDVTATGTLTAHLIPSLNLGVSALGGKAKAQIFLDLDTNASLEMNLDGSASATKVIDNSAAAAGDDASADATDDGTTDDSTEDDSTEEGDEGTTEDDGEVVDDGSEDDQTTLDPDTLDNSADSTDDTTDSTDAETDDTATDDSETADDSSSDLQPVFVNSAGQLVDGDGNPVQTTEDASTEDTATDDSDSQDTTDSDAQDDSSEDASTEDTATDDSDSQDTTDSDAQDDSSDSDSVQRRKASKDTKADSTDDSQDADTADSDSTDETTDDTSGDVVDDSSDDTTDDSQDADTADSDSTDETTDDTSGDTVDDSSDDNGTETTDDGIDTTKSLGGCINVNGAISVNAGAEGSFFGLFDKFANAQLFNKNFKIFTKCFGDQATGAATDNSTAVDDGTDATAVDDGTATDSTDDGTDTDSTDDTADDSSDTTDATDSTDDSSVDDTSDSATADDSTTDSSRKRTIRRFAAPSSLERRIALTCPLASSSKKLGVTKGTVKSSSIKSSTA